ncbi:BatD family protein, partial [Singulisphaera rosea]
MRRTYLATTALAILLTMTAGSFADEPVMVVEAGATEIFSGESLDYIVEIRNVDSPVPPDVTALRKDFEVVAAGDESRNQSSRFIINGRVTEEHIYGHVYHFRLTPKRSGVLTIPAPTATIAGNTITGQELPLKVSVPEAQDLVIAEIKTSRPRLYPTQPFEVTLRILVRPLPDNADLDP